MKLQNIGVGEEAEQLEMQWLPSSPIELVGARMLDGKELPFGLNK